MKVTFLRNGNLSESHIVDIVQIISQFVIYSNLNDNKLSLCERSVPDIVRTICKESRVDNGYRLMKRANRHAVDPRTRQMVNANGCIKIFDNTVCLEVTMKVLISTSFSVKSL